LPEAQLDRFMFNILLDYPAFEDEVNIVRKTTSAGETSLNQVISRDEILLYQDLIHRVPVNQSVIEWAVKLASKTRAGSIHAHAMAKEYLTWGAGPRASQYLILGAKTHAVLNGKYSPDIEDVRAIAPAILRHRIIRNYKAEARGISVEDIIHEMLA
jgi:MoxR-like ATPase